MYLILLLLLVGIGALIYYYIRGNQILDGLDKKPVLITGCDSGFGHDLVLRLCSQRIPTIAGCFTEEGIVQLRADVSSKSATALSCLSTILIDVTNQASLDSALKKVQQIVGPTGLWAVVNNAGVLGSIGPDDWLTVDSYQQTLNVNTLGAIRTTHTFTDLLKPQRGRIITMSSVAGRFACAFCGPYTVSKYAIEGYCDVIRYAVGFTAKYIFVPLSIVPTDAIDVLINFFNKLQKRN